MTRRREWLLLDRPDVGSRATDTPTADDGFVYRLDPSVLYAYGPRRHRVDATVLAMVSHQDKRLDLALRIALGIGAGGPLGADDAELVREAVARGWSVTTHPRSTGRPHIQIRDSEGRVFWDGWWDAGDHGTMTWREEWAAEREPHAAG